MLNNKLLYYRISYQRYAIVIHIHCTYNSCNIYRHEWCACYTCLKSKGWGYGIHIRQITSAYVTNNQGCVMQVLKCLIPMLCVSNTVHTSYNLNVTRMVYAETTRVAHACFCQKHTMTHATNYLCVQGYTCLHHLLTRKVEFTRTHVCWLW